jgi:hypothetical protein
VGAKEYKDYGLCQSGFFAICKKIMIFIFYDVLKLYGIAIYGFSDFA